MVVFNPVKAFIILALAASVSGDCTQMLKLVNDERAKNGAAALTLDQRLINAAQKHSELMDQQKTMSHQLPGEKPFSDRITDEGYNWRSAGENVAFGYPDETAVMKGWMDSSGHRANILSTNFQNMGCGKQGTYWTQDFGTLQSGSAQPPSSSPPTQSPSSTSTPTPTPTPTPPPSNPSPPPSNPSPPPSNPTGGRRRRPWRRPRRVVHTDTGNFTGYRRK